MENTQYSNQKPNIGNVVNMTVAPPTPERPESKPNSKNIKKILLISSVFAVIVFFLVFLFTFFKNLKSKDQSTKQKNPTIASLEKFKSEEEFKNYLEEGKSLAESFGGFGNLEMLALDGAPPITGGGFGVTRSTAELTQKSDLVQRISETNVQVKGIDEPDILKSDGKNIFYSGQYFYRGDPIPLPLMESRDTSKVVPDYNVPETKIVEAFPPEKLKLASQIKESGDLLLYKNKLIVFANQKVITYDVSNTTTPTESWKMDLKDNNSIITARLMGDFVYLVTATRVTPYDSCLRPIMGGTREISIMCTDIYRPGFPTPSDSTYTVFKINPENGEVKDKTSFIGSLSSSVTYMSPNAVYISYSISEGITNIMIDFFTNEGQNLLPTTVIEKIKKVKDYDISTETKMLEVQKIVEGYQNSLTNDERRKMENDLSNRMEDYVKKKSRELIQTAIAKIDINSFKMTTSQFIPGTPLNQFSLDEYNGNLRIATTIGGGMFGSDVSANDVYILDNNLSQIGSVKDMGLTERIYSVRFIEDKGYVVTFKQIDPFYVLDLSDPNNPKRVGELKIPGYSGYLHPINKNKIIGVGMEGSNVKISLFDVQNPQTPLEVSKYDLDEYYSEAVNNHHAFLLDPEKDIFFMPGSKGGYIFSYSGDTFSLKKVVADMVARRALYINNYLYIAGDDKVIVLNLDNYDEANRLTF